MPKFTAISRRNMLFTAGGGISGLALANLLGQEGFLRFFRVELCAAEGWLEVEAEAQAF